MLRRRVPQELVKLKKSIQEHNNDLPFFNFETANSVIYDKNWFSDKITNYTLDKIYSKVNFDEKNFKDDKIENKTLKLKCSLNNTQREILNFWFNADKKMYNLTVSFIRKKLPNCEIKRYKELYRFAKIYFDFTSEIENLNKKKNKELKKISKIQNKLDKCHDYNKSCNLQQELYQIKANIKDFNIEIDNVMKKQLKYKHYLPKYNKLKEKINNFTNYKNLRTNFLIDIKNEIYDAYKFTSIYSHSIDASIKRACASYKSCITRFLKNQIKRFRIKCLNENNKKGFVEMEKTTFNKNENNYIIAKNILGEIKYLNEGKKFIITEPSTSNFYCDGNNYWLLYTQNIDKNKKFEKNKDKKEYISLDSGVRVFQTGFSKDHTVDFGFDVYDKLKKYIYKIDNLNKNQTIENEIFMCKNKIKNYENVLEKINNLEIKKKINNNIYHNLERITKLEKLNLNEKQKTKYEMYLNYNRHNKANYYYNIISRKINELHWKLCNFLVKNYELVVIGKFSSKNASQGDNLCATVKRIGILMRHYNFRERLVYKCLTNNVKIIVSDEKFTTKVCTFCGNYDKDIKGEKEINCKKCFKKYPRDAYSARNILIKNLI